jgi:hypothetical protein
MSQSGKSKGTVRVYYQFPPKGLETSPHQLTLEDVKKYFSDKPLRRGPERQAREDRGKGPEKADPRPDSAKPSDSGTA